MNGETAPETATRSRGQALGPRRLFEGMKRRWRWSFLAALAAAFISSTFVLLAPPSFVGVAKAPLADQEAIEQAAVQRQAEAKAAAAGAARALLSAKIEEARARIADAEAKLAAFPAQSGLPAGADRRPPPAQQLSDLTAELANARSAQAAATARVDLLRRLELEGRLDEAPDSITDPSMRRFVEQRLALKAEIAEAARTLLPMHPRMKDLAAQLASLDAQIRDAAARNERVLENDVGLARDQVASLNATVEQQSKAVATGDEGEAKLRALEADAKTARGELDSYLEKHREAEAQSAVSAAPKAQVIAASDPPRAPTMARAWETIALSTLAALAISGALAAAATLLSGKREAAAPSAGEATKAQGEQGSGSEAARIVAPSSIGAPDRETAPEDGADAVDPTAVLADRLAGARAPGCSQVVLVTGQRCGQTLAIALETARRLSPGASTLLVDLGATQDWLPDILDREEPGEAEVRGLADLLAGAAGFGEIIRRDLSSSVDVIASGGDVSSAGSLDEVFEALASSYGCVVAHASDWRTPAARTAARCADAIVVAAPESRLPHALETAQEDLGRAGLEFIPFAARRSEPAFDEAA